MATDTGRSTKHPVATAARIPSLQPKREKLAVTPYLVIIPVPHNSYARQSTFDAVIRERRQGTHVPCAAE